jgi:hypothetical protein
MARCGNGLSLVPRCMWPPRDAALISEIDGVSHSQLLGGLRWTADCARVIRVHASAIES